MLYVLLVIIIVLQLVIIYRGRDRGAHFRKAFSQKIENSDYVKDDPRNKTHPDEWVKMKDGSILSRKMAGIANTIEEWPKK